MAYNDDFLSFMRDLVVVEGAFGPHPVIPPFLERWLSLAFPGPDGHPAARNILDLRTKKQGKSSLAAAVALYLASRTPGAEVAIVAADQDQAADRVLRACKYAVENGPLARHARVYKAGLIELDNGGQIKALPADWKGAAGGNYAGVIFDELHAWTLESDRRRFDEYVIPPTVAHGCRWVSSYAGYLGESVLLKELWDRALDGQRIDPELPVYKDEAASLLALVDTGPQSWRMPWMTPEYIEQTRASERPNTFRRLWLNEWTSAESQFLPAGVWEGCQAAIDPLGANDRRKVWVGVDASTSRDYTALVGVTWNRRENIFDVLHVRVWKPERSFLRLGKPTIDLEATVGAEVERLRKAGQLAGVVCDPYQLHTLIVAWQKAGIKVIELPQSSGRVESDQALFDTVVAHRLRHYGDPELSAAVRNAVALETSRGLRLAKEKTSLKIDAAVALAMGLYGAREKMQRRGAEPVVIIDDPWDYEPGAGEFLKLPDGGLQFIPGKVNRAPHPPGVTWRNCPHSAQGCQTCVDEQDEDGSYWQFIADAEEHARAAELGTFRQQLEAEELARLDRKQQADDRRSQNEHILKAFWNSARRGQS